MNPERAGKTPPRKWYREPYVWLLIAFPLTAVIGGSITAILALESDDGLVVDDYYNQGLEINQVLERDQAAVNQGIEAKLQISREQHSIRLFLSGNESFKPPAQLSVSFLHATRSGFDQKILASSKDGNLYQAELPVLVPGRWNVQIETDNWRVLKSLSIE